MPDEVISFVVSDISGFDLSVVYETIKAPVVFLVGVMAAYLVIFLGVKSFITVVSE